MEHKHAQQPRNIGFVATRIAGTDGVSLEIGKWADVLERMGHHCYYISGLSDRPAERTRIIAEARLNQPVINEINEACFGRELRSLEVTRKIHETLWVIKQKLHQVLKDFQLDVIIAENCLTIPMNIPLGLALVEFVMETGVGCIAHHHDFTWERERFTVNAVDDYLRAAFPPPLRQIQHVVINSQAAREFSRRVGLSCRVVPNVMDFDNPPQVSSAWLGKFRKAIGLSPEDRLILQPTRLVARKGIEHSIELISALGDPRSKLVITHASGDEGDTYAERVRNYARRMGVVVIFAESLIAANERSRRPDQFTVEHAYFDADFVTYPSSYEGFGNAFLEAVYYKKPILCNRYAIYRTDIEPCGFKVVLMEGFLTDDVVEHARRVLADENYRREMVEHNYEVATEFFSYVRLEAELRTLLAKPRLASHHS